MKSLKQIKSLLQFLPEKDRNFGNKLFAEKNFSSLKELTDTVIYHLEKDKNSLESSTLENLNTLSSELDFYIYQEEPLINDTEKQNIYNIEYFDDELII